MTIALVVVWGLSLAKHLLVSWEALTQEGGVSILPMLDILFLALSFALIALGARPFEMGATGTVVVSLVPSFLFYGAVALASLLSRR